MYQLPSWAEPLIVLTILLCSMFMSRRRNFRILCQQKRGYHDSVLDDPDSARSSDELLWFDAANEDDAQGPRAASKQLPKRRDVCGLVLQTPNSSRFANHLHSRVLQKFPFVAEMFYWVITYLFYRMTKMVSQAVFSKTGIWDVAQENGLSVLEFEQFSPLNFLFPISEHDVQHWFMDSHPTALTVLN